MHDTLNSSRLEAKASKAKLIFALSFYPLLVLYLVFACPILGNIVYMNLHDSIGAHCPSGNAARAVQCFYNGVDIGKLQYNYGIGLLALGLINPILAFSVIDALVPRWPLLLWLVTIIGSFLLKTRYQVQLSK